MSGCTMERPITNRWTVAAIGVLSLLASEIAGAEGPDVNGDGIVDIFDVSLAGSCYGLDFSVAPQCAAADTNGDNTVDLTDINLIVSYFGQVIPTCDGRMALFSSQFPEAYECFQKRLAIDTGDEQANFFYAFARILRILEVQEDGPDTNTYTDSFKEMLDRFGASQEGRSLFAFSPTFPDPLPATAPTGDDVQQFIRKTLAV